MNCPDCKGEKVTQALVNRGAMGCSWESIKCVTCLGTGNVRADYSAAREAALAEGAILRRYRLERDESLLDAATRLNITVTEYSRLERGVV